MMTRKKKLIAATAFATLAFVAVGCAKHAYKHAHNPEKVQSFVSHRVDVALDAIDADASQRAEIHEIKERLFVEMEGVHTGSRGTHQTLLTEWKSDKPDEKLLHELVDQRILEIQKVAHESVDGMLQAHAALTPEQRKQLAGRFEEHMKKHEQR